MTRFAFVVEGPPVSVNAKDKQTRKYQAWIRTVREAARLAWPFPSVLPGDTETNVRIVNYHTAQPLDVDNVIKPVLDGLNGVVYGDDSQVWRVSSERIAIDRDVIGDVEALAVVGRFTEFLFIEVSWQSE